MATSSTSAASVPAAEVGEDDLCFGGVGELEEEGLAEDEGDQAPCGVVDCLGFHGVALACVGWVLVFYVSGREATAWAEELFCRFGGGGVCDAVFCPTKWPIRCLFLCT